MPELYIAFSIKGTEAFITANKKVPIIHASQIPKGMKVANSRREDYDPKKATKLHWDRLLTQKGEPIKSPPMILARFKELAKMEFVIDKKVFVEKHYHAQYRKQRGEDQSVSR